MDKLQQEAIKDGLLKNDWNQSDEHNASMEELRDARRMLAANHNHKNEVYRENYIIAFGHD